MLRPMHRLTPLPVLGQRGLVVSRLRGVQSATSTRAGMGATAERKQIYSGFTLRGRRGVSGGAATVTSLAQQQQASQERHSMRPGDSQQTRALLYEKEQVVSSLQQLQHFDDYAGAAAANGFDSYGFPIQKYRVLPQVPLFNDGDGTMLLSNNRTAAAAVSAAAVTSAGRGSEYIHACEVGNE